MAPNIRPMQKSDIDTVYAIECAAHRVPWNRDILSDCLLVGYDCRVLEIGREITSYSICRYNANVCHILNICVAPLQQRKGYGQLLLEDIIQNPSRTGINSLVLEVRPSNLAAVSLYQKVGFQQIGIKPGYYSDEEGVEDGMVLQKQR